MLVELTSGSLFTNIFMNSVCCQIKDAWLRKDRSPLYADVIRTCSSCPGTRQVEVVAQAPGSPRAHFL